jgi:MFS family permease
MVHLVNYATDLGISSLIAATFISVIGIGSVTGRVTMGAFSDRIGSHNALLICCVILAGTLILLIFSKELWMFYFFAIVFGFAYGGEVPQMAALVGSFFGLHAVTVLVGIITMSARMGGALGSYLGGAIFDVTDSYRFAFGIASVAGFIAVIAARRICGQLKSRNSTIGSQSATTRKTGGLNFRP